MQSRDKGALAESRFKPFKCHVLVEMPNYPRALFPDIRNDAVPGDLISVYASKENTVRDYFTDTAQEQPKAK